jgi:hypothetical protein
MRQPPGYKFQTMTLERDIKTQYVTHTHIANPSNLRDVIKNT